MGDEEEVYAPFVLLASLCLARGEDSLSQRTPPGQCWRIPIDSMWEAWMNPHRTPAPTEPGASAEVPAFSAYVTYNGWPWGILDPFGGFHGQHPQEGAGNMESFVRAVTAATARAGGRHA